MPRVFHEKTFIRRVAGNVDLKLSILIGQAQHGEWWVWIDDKTVGHGEDTQVDIPLGPAAALYGHLVQVEVRCDDTNPQTDKLACRIALAPVAPTVDWKTDNEGEETPHGMMTSVADILILPPSEPVQQ